MYDVHGNISIQRSYYNANDNKISQKIDLLRRNKVHNQSNHLNAQDLTSSTETNGFTIPSADNPSELQTHEYIDITSTVHPNNFLDNIEDTTMSTKSLFNKPIDKCKFSTDVNPADSENEI